MSLRTLFCVCQTTPPTPPLQTRAATSIDRASLRCHRCLLRHLPKTTTATATATTLVLRRRCRPPGDPPPSAGPAASGPSACTSDTIRLAFGEVKCWVLLLEFFFFFKSVSILSRCLPASRTPSTPFRACSSPTSWRSPPPAAAAAAVAGTPPTFLRWACPPLAAAAPPTAATMARSTTLSPPGTAQPQTPGKHLQSVVSHIW